MISASRAGLRRRLASRARSCVVHGAELFDWSGMVHSGDKPHRIDEGLPGVALARQHASAFGREAVETSAPLSRLFHPLALQPPALLEAIEQGIQGRDVELQLAARLRLNQLADLVAVARARFDDRQDDELRRSLFELAVQHATVHSCHNHICYRRMNILASWVCANVTAGE